MANVTHKFAIRPQFLRAGSQSASEGETTTEDFPIPPPYIPTKEDIHCSWELRERQQRANEMIKRDERPLR